MLDFIRNISPTELAIIALILVVFFGGRMATNIARSAGESLKEIKKIKKNFVEAIDEEKPHEQRGV